MAQPKFSSRMLVLRRVQAASAGAEGDLNLDFKTGGGKERGNQNMSAAW